MKETPHRENEAYDVLDEQGLRMEHHYAIQETTRQTKYGSTIHMNDVKKVDLYNPKTQKLQGTYTLDHWRPGKGHIKHIGFVDDNGKMISMDFAPEQQLGQANYYADSLSVEDIKGLYHDELQFRQQQQMTRTKWYNIFGK